MIKTVYGLRQRITYARHGANQIGARTQVRYFAQILNAMAFCRHRVSIRIVNPTHNFDSRRLQFKALAFARGGNYGAGDFNRATGGQTQNFILIIGQRIIYDGL